MEKMVEISRSFRSMNTDIEAVLCVPEDCQKIGRQALIRTERLFERAEETLSRFKPESELSRLNFCAGFSFKASPMLFQVVKASLRAARMTAGIFDLTILPNLLAAGYDRSFEKLAENKNVPQPNNSKEKGRWRDIELEPASSSIFLPERCSIDLGGIGKGWTVDQACYGLESFSNYAVDAGGDIRVKGNKVDGLPWTVGIADPLNEGRDLDVVELSRGAVCTSTSARRRWEFAGRWQHHIIDPRTGDPSQSEVISATVIADSAVRAEIISKTIIILGQEEGLKFVESQPGTQAFLVLRDGRLLHSAGFRELQYVA